MRLFVEAVADELVLSGAMDKIQTHLVAELPNECVGMVWDDGEVVQLINQARSPNRFAVSLPQLAIELGRREGIVMALYHSHPGGSPTLSTEDRFNMEDQFKRGVGTPWLVVTESEANLFFPEAGVVGSVPVRNGLVRA